MRLFDAHCHLQDERLSDPDAVIRRAVAAGVERMLCCGSSEEDWADVLALAQQHAAVLPSFGLHPWYVAGRTPKWKDTLREYLARIPSAVGEAGLDHAIENRNDADQEEVFVAQLRIATDLGRPITIHCRRGWDRMLALLAEAGPLQSGFVLHSYSGGPDLVPPLAKLGAYFSFSGSITRSGNKRGHRAACAVPADRLLIETDAPDMTPVIDHAVSDAPNEPAHLVHVLRAVAGLRHLSEDEIARLTWENACRVFAAGS